MNINFQAVTGNRSEESRELFGMDTREGLRTVSGKSAAAGTEVIGVQLNSSIFSNDAYASHARSCKDISEMAENTDVMTQHNYMALLSNTMSAEDFAKAAKDGFDIKNMDSAETVTIIDKIKSVLLQSGEKVVGFNDDLDVDKLTKITGSRSFAQALQKSFHENDIPLSYDNTKEASIAYREVSEIQGLDDGAVKYLVLNELDPTIENLYLANHSTNGQNAMGRGFYAQDADGYYAQKAETFDWEQLDAQIDKIIDEAMLDKNDENVRNQARWIVSQGIPLTADSLQRVHEIRDISFPISQEQGAKAIAAAIFDGKKSTQADLGDPRSSFRKASDLLNDTEKITDDDIRTGIQSGKEINLRNLINESAKNYINPQNAELCNIEYTDERFVTARLQLEEVRLRMTVEANRQLLSSGFSIDTAPMEQLINRLKGILGESADEAAGSAIDEITGIDTKSKNYLITATISRVSIIREGPVDISGYMGDELETASLSAISDVSRSLTARYQKAGQGYEALMTKPRADLGDNIKKAFSNVSDILEDLKIEDTEDNRRAVRILGYNSMEITKENLEKVNSWDMMLRTTIERLKPGAVLDLIRDGNNPLDMTIEELARNLDQGLFGGDEENSEKGNTKSDEKYSKFLYKLEHKNGITQEEKTSFIGIYRLFHTLKKDDYQAIGSILKTGREMTLGNLLQATRSQSRAYKGMDLVVDDDFGGLDAASGNTGIKIDEQIKTAFRFYSAQADIVYENLEPEKLLEAKPDESTLLPNLARDLQQAGTDETLEKDYYAQQLRHIREVAQDKEAQNAAVELTNTGLELNFNNLEAEISNRRQRKSSDLWQKSEELLGEKVAKEHKLLVDALDEDNYGDIYRNTLENISNSLTDLIMGNTDSFIDVRAINQVMRRLSVMSQGSESGTFDVPAEIDGQEITMHITIKQDESMESRMEASVQTYEYGLITAVLQAKNGIVSGMLTTTYAQSSEEAEYLESVRSKMCVKLAEKLKDYGVGQEQIAILYHAQTQPISVGTANANATDGNPKNITDTKTLLSMAKAFIEAL